MARPMRSDEGGAFHLARNRKGLQPSLFISARDLGLAPKAGMAAGLWP